MAGAGAERWSNALEKAAGPGRKATGEVCLTFRTVVRIDDCSGGWRGLVSGGVNLAEERPKGIHFLELKACLLPPISEGGAN